MLSWKKIWQVSRKWVLNKYVLTCVLFAVVLTFCGEQSMLNRIRQARQISALERERDECRQQSEKYRNDIRLLRENTDSLERFAREHYYMHADGETVYLIGDEE